MTGKQEFIELVDDLLQSGTSQKKTKGAMNYFEWFKTQTEKKGDKPAELSDKAQTVLKYMQENKTVNLFKAKAIADALGMNSKSVSGTLRKLRTDGYIQKISDEGVSPIIYSLKEN